MPFPVFGMSKRKAMRASDISSFFLSLHACLKKNCQKVVGCRVKEISAVCRIRSDSEGGEGVSEISGFFFFPCTWFHVREVKTKKKKLRERRRGVKLSLCREEKR